MSAAVLASGWLVAALVGLRLLELRRRLRLVALADHELRGPVAALALAGAALRRKAATRAAGLLLEGQVARLEVALADLAAARAGERAGGTPAPLRVGPAGRAVAAGFAGLARQGGRRLRGDWRLDDSVRMDRGRFAQALGNVLANALEHGRGEIAVATARAGGSVRVEVRDEGDGRGAAPPRPGRGNGLAIARRAVEEAGGSLTMAAADGGTRVTIELPVAEPGGPGGP